MLDVRGWFPDVFGDIVWEHTRQLLEAHSFVSIESRIPTKSKTAASEKCSAAIQTSVVWQTTHNSGWISHQVKQDPYRDLLL